MARILLGLFPPTPFALNAILFPFGETFISPLALIFEVQGMCAGPTAESTGVKEIPEDVTRKARKLFNRQ